MLIIMALIPKITYLFLNLNDGSKDKRNQYRVFVKIGIFLDHIKKNISMFGHQNYILSVIINAILSYNCTSEIQKT